MRLHSVTVRNYRIHRELSVEFHDRLTLVTGPNEAGKTTLVEAVHRGLFLRAKTTGRLVARMRSRIHVGHPSVELRFEADGGTWRLTKLFAGAAGTTRLEREGGATLLDAAAEQRLAELCSVTPPGRNQTRLDESWQHLWVWQGTAVRNPIDIFNDQDSGDTREQLLGVLRGQPGVLAESTLDARVTAAVTSLWEDTYQANGRLKPTSSLQQAIAATAEATRLANAIDGECRALQQASLLMTESRQVAGELAEQLAELRAERALTQAAIDAIDRLEGRARNQEADDAAARRAVDDLEKIDDDIRRHTRSIAALQQSLADGRRAAAALLVTLENRREELTAARERAVAGQQAFERDDAAREGARQAVEHAELDRKVEELSERVRKIDQWRQDRGRLEGEREATPRVTAADVTALDGLAADVTRLRDRLAGMAADVTLLAGEGVNVAGLPLERDRPLRLTADAEVVVGDSVRLRIRPGGGDSLAEIEWALEAAELDLRGRLAALRCEDVAEARRIMNRLAEIDREIKRIDERIADASGDDATEELARARGARDAARTAFERLCPGAPLPESLEAAREALETATQRRQISAGLRDQANTDRTAAETASAAAEQAEAEARAAIAAEDARERGLEALVRELEATHGSAEQRAGKLNVLRGERDLAGDLLAATRRELAELEPDRTRAEHARLERAITEKDAERQQAELRAENARGQLEPKGGSDLPAAREAALAAAEAARAAEAREQLRADALMRLHNLLQAERRTLHRELAGPLNERIGGYVARMYGGGASASVTLDGNRLLAFELVRRDGLAGALGFDDASFGAREQVAAAFRLALAEVLAESHGGTLPLVFDDAFTSSDPDRVRMVLGMLDLAAERGLQVIVLTCDPRRYTSLGGRTIRLERNVTGNLAAAACPVGDDGDGGDGGASEDDDWLNDNDSDADDEAIGVEGQPTAGPSDALAERFLETLRSLGGSAGNGRLRDALGLDEPAYEAVKAALLAAGRVAKGRGQGGSVRLA